jgi:hypothetical protein
MIQLLVDPCPVYSSWCLATGLHALSKGSPALERPALSSSRRRPLNRPTIPHRSGLTSIYHFRSKQRYLMLFKIETNYVSVSLLSWWPLFHISQERFCRPWSGLLEIFRCIVDPCQACSWVSCDFGKIKFISTQVQPYIEPTALLCHLNCFQNRIILLISSLS